MAKAAACITTSTNSPTTPYTPIDDWIPLQATEQHWYAFRDEGDDTAVTVRLKAEPANRVNFRLFTATQIVDYIRGKRVTGVGASAAEPALGGDAHWTGSFVQSGIYYILVQSDRLNERTHTTGYSYRITVSGEKVSFPLLSFTQPTPPTADQIRCTHGDLQTSPPTINPVPQALASSPEEPLAAVGRFVAIAPDARHWYAFRDEGDDAAIEIAADAIPADCLTFELWTPAQLGLWQRGEPFQPVGRGTPNALLKADLFWTGSFVKSGTYYVVVELNPAFQGRCTYQLHVTGRDVSLIVAANRP